MQFLLPQKIFQSFSLICVNGFCLGFVIWRTWQCVKNYQDHPVGTRLSLEESASLPFPAITVCGRHSGKFGWTSFNETYLEKNLPHQVLHMYLCGKAKQRVLENVIRTNFCIQKSKVQNNIMCPLGDSSWYRQPILPKFGGFFGLCCTSPLKGHMIWFCTLLFCIPQ